MDNGIGFITEDRKTEGLMLEESIMKNISIPVLCAFPGSICFFYFILLLIFWQYNFQEIRIIYASVVTIHTKIVVNRYEI